MEKRFLKVKDHQYSSTVPMYIDLNSVCRIDMNKNQNGYCIMLYNGSINVDETDYKRILAAIKSEII